MSLFKRVVVVSFVLVLSGCSSLADVSWLDRPDSSVSEAVVIADPTASDACSEASLQRLLRLLVERRDGPVVSLYRLDAHVGSRLMARFTPTKPASQAKKVLALHREQMLHEAERLFAAVIPTIFTDVPKTSTLAAAILTATASRAGPVDLYLASDAREVSGLASFETGRPLPNPKLWRARLSSIGFTTESLRGVNVHFVGMPLIARSDRDGSPARGLAIQALWRELVAFGARSVTFEEDRQGALLLLFAPWGYYWRRFRVWLIGRFDGKRNYHDRRGAVESQLGPRPQPEWDDPEVAEAINTVNEERGNIDELKAELKALKRAIAKVPWWVPLVAGIVLAALADASGTTSQFADFGVGRPERYVYGGALALSLFALAGLAGKATKLSGKRPGWWYVVIGVIAVLSSSLTIVRVMNAAATGDPLFAEIAKGITHLATVIGPALIAELLFEKLRITMPLVKLRWSLNHQLRTAQRAYHKALAFLTAQARRRQAYEWECSVLCAIYTRAFIASGGQVPPPTIEHFPPAPPPPSSRENGLPSWPA